MSQNQETKPEAKQKANPQPKTQEILQDRREYSPISLIVLPVPLADLVLALPLPLLTVPEETLHTLTRPTRQQMQLKIKFHEEYCACIQNLHQGQMQAPFDSSPHFSHQSQNQAHPTITRMDLQKILQGVCSVGIFDDWVKSPNFLAWLITPQCPAEVLISELLYSGLQNLRGILQMPTVDDEGKPQTTLINTQLAIVKLLDSRKHGTPVQRVEQKTQTIPAPQTPQAASPLLAPPTELLERIQQLERSFGKVLPAPAPTIPQSRPSTSQAPEDA